MMAYTDSGKILLEALEGRTISERVLVIHADSALISETLRMRGTQVVEWNWIWSSRECVLWPSDEVFHTVVLHLPAIRALTDVVIEVTASRMKKGDQLFVYGSNREGMKSIKDHLAPWFEEAEVVSLTHRQRVIRATRTSCVTGLHRTLEEWESNISVQIGERMCSFVSYPGMFAHGEMDEGTRLFVDHLPRCMRGGRVLDMGCGMGILARALQEKAPDCVIDAVDIHAFAIEATKKNVPGAITYWGDGWKALPFDTMYDVIVSNPPVHQGITQTMKIVEYFLQDTKTHLLPDGSIRLVVQRTIPVERIMKRSGLMVQLIAENKTYQVWEGR